MVAGVTLGVVESLATVLLGGGWREVVASATVLLWLLVRERAVLADE
jgi:branched-subunit amino acid ABC-type transport system permease component